MKKKIVAVMMAAMMAALPVSAMASEAETSAETEAASEAAETEAASEEETEAAEKVDLTGMKIGVQLGTTGDLSVTEEYGDDAVERYNKGFEAVQALLQGKIDAVVIDELPAEEVKNPGRCIQPGGLCNLLCQGQPGTDRQGE